MEMIMLLFCLTISSLLLTSHSSCLHDQHALLLKFKHEFVGASKTENWIAGGDCCRWDGVECDKSGHVVGLNLAEGSLQGPLRPNSSLFGLTHLRGLNLAENDFAYSAIPSGFGRLLGLKKLNLSQSMLSGQIPREISWLKGLFSLDLSSLNYPDEPHLALGKEVMRGLIQNATGLIELRLNVVDLSSLDPKAFGNFTSLEVLSLNQCQLKGQFPENIFFLPKIREINIGSNDDLVGSIPGFASRSRLELLDLSITKFNGSLPDSIGSLEYLNNLKLYDCNFSGTVPDSIGYLSRLSFLDLSENVFTGELPFSLGRLAGLETLLVSKNQLAGKIPSSLGNLTRLSDLQLSYNLFSGEFPVSLANLTGLSSFDISYNQLSGPVPNDLTKIPSSSSIWSFDLSHNFFSGKIPTLLFDMPSLISLSLDNNMFTGPLIIRNVSSSQLNSLSIRRNSLTGEFPKAISELTSLTTLYLNANNLTGELDLALFSNITGLVYLELSYNNLSIINTTPDSTSLTGLEILGLASCNITEFPNLLKAQTGLSTLDLSNNRISGKIPRWFLGVGTETLSRLYLSGNRISGWEKEPSVLPWKVLNYLDLSNNKLRGSLVPPQDSINQFFASRNSLTGEISPLFCELPNLGVLDISDNNITGEIPGCLGLNGSLSVLNLKQNTLRGRIPPICSEGSGLKTLDLSHNELHGTVPRSLIECRDLEVLNIGHNRIIDEFPYWTQDLPHLQVLVLRDNSFHGSIWHPGKFSGFNKLRIIDLSLNDFGGDLSPDYFQNWTAMSSEIVNKSLLRYMGDSDNYYQDSMTLLNRGLDMSYKKILTTLMAIDLSNNGFLGQIPSSIGDLKSLIVLNLSNNNFGGPIPLSLGDLNSLESLDLSKNELSGKIPHRLSGLNFLAYLNLSDNHLQGQVPHGGQLDTFSNVSYGGNEGLCGFPLTKKCRNDVEENTSPGGEIGKEIGFDWTAMAIGCVCGLVIGLIVEHIVSFRRPNWLYRRSISQI